MVVRYVGTVQNVCSCYSVVRYEGTVQNLSLQVKVDI